MTISMHIDSPALASVYEDDDSSRIHERAFMSLFSYSMGESAACGSAAELSLSTKSLHHSVKEVLTMYCQGLPSL